MNPNPTTSQPQPQHFDKLSASPQPQPQYSPDYELYELRVTKQDKGGFTVQIKSYKEMGNLFRLVDEIKASLKEDVRVQVATVNGETLYRLMVGKFATRAEAETFRNRAVSSYPDCFVVEMK